MTDVNANEVTATEPREDAARGLWRSRAESRDGRRCTPESIFGFPRSRRTTSPCAPPARCRGTRREEAEGQARDTQGPVRPNLDLRAKAGFTPAEATGAWGAGPCNAPQLNMVALRGFEPRFDG